MRKRPAAAGFTLVELIVVLAVIGAAVAVAVPTTGRWLNNQRLLAASQDVEALLSYARGEAVRTGNLHLVFFNTDADGNALADELGAPVDMLVIDDGRPGDALQNCSVDAGEAALGFPLRQGVVYGVTAAVGTAPDDGGGGVMATGATFTDAAAVQASWVMFRPEGIPLAFSNNCAMGAVGSGTGGLYLTNGTRDFSVVVSPLGMSRSHGWDSVLGAWGT